MKSSLEIMIPKRLFNPLMTGAVIMDWVLYDNGLRHERVKGHYKTTTTSQNVSFETQVKNLCFVKIFKFLYFQLSHDLPSLWRHNEY